MLFTKGERCRVCRPETSMSKNRKRYGVTTRCRYVCTTNYVCRVLGRIRAAPTGDLPFFLIFRTIPRTLTLQLLHLDLEHACTLAVLILQTQLVVFEHCSPHGLLRYQSCLHVGWDEGSEQVAGFVEYCVVEDQPQDGLKFSW